MESLNLIEINYKNKSSIEINAAKDNRDDENMIL